MQRGRDECHGGRPQDRAADMRFGVNGKWFLMSQIPELSTEYWFTGKQGYHAYS